MFSLDQNKTTEKFKRQRQEEMKTSGKKTSSFVLLQQKKKTKDKMEVHKHAFIEISPFNQLLYNIL